MTSLTDFLVARIADDEAGVKSGFGAGDVDYRAISPHRWLAECETKRRILDEHDDYGSDQCPRCRGIKNRRLAAPCNTLRFLALPYANHPDYRDEWRPYRM